MILFENDFKFIFNAVVSEKSSVETFRKITVKVYAFEGQLADFLPKNDFIVDFFWRIF